MKLTVNRREAGSLAAAMLILRAFQYLALDSADYGNARWICALGGMALALPVAALLARGRSRALYAVLALLGAVEASRIAGTILETAEYCGLNALPPKLTLLMTLLGCFYAIGKAGAGIGNGARLWSMVFLTLAVLVLIAEVRHLEPLWLAPLLGPGPLKLLRGSVSCAGIYLGGFSVWLLADGPKSEHKFEPRPLMLGGLVTTGLCLYLGMMAPAALEAADRVFRLDELIANGRASLSLQLPVVFLWFMGLIAALCGYGFLSAAALNRLLPKLDSRLLTFVSLAGVFALTGLNLPADIGGLYYFLFLAFDMIGCIINAVRSGKERT